MTEYEMVDVPNECLESFINPTENKALFIIFAHNKIHSTIYYHFNHPHIHQTRRDLNSFFNGKKCCFSPVE